jgi:hypothetical protein
VIVVEGVHWNSLANLLERSKNLSVSEQNEVTGEMSGAYGSYGFEMNPSSSGFAIELVEM